MKTNGQQTVCQICSWSAIAYMTSRPAHFMQITSFICSVTILLKYKQPRRAAGNLCKLCIIGVSVKALCKSMYSRTQALKRLQSTLSYWKKTSKCKSLPWEKLMPVAAPLLRCWGALVLGLSALQGPDEYPF